MQVKVSINVTFRKISNIDTINDRFSADVLVKASWREPRLDGDCSEKVRLQDYDTSKLCQVPDYLIVI